MTWRPGFNPSSSHTKTQKIVLDAALLNTQNYKVKWSNAGNGVAPSLNFGVEAIEKDAFGSPSTTVTNFTLFI